MLRELTERPSPRLMAKIIPCTAKHWAQDKDRDNGSASGYGRQLKGT